jgi:hypothetical protein
LGKSITKVKYEDLALGDFIAALGFKNENGVLDSSRILITTSPEEIEKKSLVVKVSSKTKKETKVTTPDNKELSLEITDKTLTLESKDQNIVKSKAANIEVGDKLVIVATINNLTATPTLIYLMKAPKLTPSPTTKLTPVISPRPTKYISPPPQAIP